MLRNYTFFIVMGCVIFSAAASAVAADNKTASGKKVSASGRSSSAFGGSSDIKASNNQMGYQFISTFVDYTEIGSGRLGTATGTLDTETGPVNGRGYYFSSMSDVLFGNDYFKATFDQSSGFTNYVGGTLSPPSPYGSVVSSSGAILTNYTARYGRGFETRGASMLTPYFEYGSHRWDRGVNFGEAYINGYYGLGLMHQRSLGNGLVFTVDAMYGKTNQSAIAVASGTGLTGFSGALGNSDLYKIGISLDYAWAQRLHLNAAVDYTAFAYGISAMYPSGVNSYIWEPDSRTNYTTARLGLGWGF